MKNIVMMTAEVLLSLIWFCAAAASAQTFPNVVVVDPELRTNKDWDRWASRVFPAFDKRVGLPNIETLYIRLEKDGECGGYAMCAVPPNTIAMSRLYLEEPIYRKTEDVGGVDPRVAHELGHLANPIPGNVFGIALTEALCEGMAEAAKDVTYEELCSQGYNVACTPRFSSARTLANLPRSAMAGNKGYYDQRDEGLLSAWIQLFTKDEDGFRSLVQAIRSLSNQRDITAGQYLQAIDQTLPRFEGKLFSTVLGSLYPTFVNGPDGAGFMAKPGADVKDSSGNVVYADQPPIIRQGNHLLWRVRRQINGIAATEYNQGEVLLQVLDASGQIVMEATPYASNHLLEFPTTPPPGAYIIKNHKCPSAPCTVSNAEFTHAMPWFALDDPLWYNDGFVLIANGDGQGGGFDQLDKVKLQVINPDPKISWTELPGGLWYFRLHGFRGDLTIKDNTGKTYTYQLHTQQTQVAFWTQLGKPFLYGVSDASNWKPQITPGSWAVAWTWGASHDDPAGAESIPLPFSLSGAKVRVTDADGHVNDAALNYASQTQINFQVPRELRFGTAKVAVTLNGTTSNEAEVEVVPENPSVFPVRTTPDGKTEGAITGIFGGQAGKLVGTRENPVGKTDWVSIWANGLGAVQPQPENAKAPSTAARVVNPVAVRLGSSSCATDFAGLAPSMVSLGQINVNLATCVGLSSGMWPLVLSVASVDSNPVWVTVL